MNPHLQLQPLCKLGRVKNLQKNMFTFTNFTGFKLLKFKIRGCYGLHYLEWLIRALSNANGRLYATAICIGNGLCVNCVDRRVTNLWVKEQKSVAVCWL